MGDVATKSPVEAKKPDLNDLSEVAHSESGQSLDPLRALVTFLIHNREEVQHDKEHTFEEALSDVFAFQGAGLGIYGSVMDMNLDSVTEKAMDIVSASCAVYLVTSLVLQRKAKERDQKIALQTWQDYERDKDDDGLGATREERVAKAKERLAKRMAAQGLMYEGLPDKADRFDRRVHEADARKYGLQVGYEPKAPRVQLNLKTRAEAVGRYLRKPVHEKIVVAAEEWANFVDRVSNAAHRIPDALIRGSKHAFDVAARPGPLFEIGVEARKSMSYESVRKTRAKKLVDKVHSKKEKLTLDDLRGVNLDNLQFVAKGLSDEERGNIKAGLQSIRDIKKRRKRALISFSLQSIFQVSQGAELVIKAYHGDPAAFRHAYTVAMASGPWKAFAKEWLDANAKINSERSKVIEYAAKSFGVRDDEKASNEPKPENENELDLVLPANDM